MVVSSFLLNKEENNMKNKKSLALFVLAVSCLSVSLSSCSNEHATKWKNAGEYTYQDYLTVSPSNWNELTYQDNNDTNIMSYIGSSFFTYDFKFDAQGKIVPGEFDIEYSAATKQKSSDRQCDRLLRS